MNRTPIIAFISECKLQVVIINQESIFILYRSEDTDEDKLIKLKNNLCNKPISKTLIFI